MKIKTLIIAAMLFASCQNTNRQMVSTEFDSVVYKQNIFDSIYKYYDEKRALEEDSADNCFQEYESNGCKECLEKSHKHNVRAIAYNDTILNYISNNGHLKFKKPYKCY